jgi:hypothetical protein
MFRIVEFQVWNSITFICAALIRASAVGRHFQQCRVSGPQRWVELAQAGNAQLVVVLLEEQLAADAARSAHQRHGPILEVRQHPLADALVIAHQVELLEARRRIDDPLGVGNLHGARSVR